VVTNQFGTHARHQAAVFLMVPTAKSMVAAGAAREPRQPLPVLPGPPVVRHAALRPIRGVSAVDQFGSHAIDILRPRYLCVPADKNDEDPTAPDALESLLCYKAKHQVRSASASRS
jgi:hypothetical protein